MPQNPISPQEPQQFPGQQLPQPGNKRMFWIVGVAVALVLVVVILLFAMGIGQVPVTTQDRQQQTTQQAIPAPETTDPVEEISEGTTIGDIEADLRALETETSLPDLDEETQALEQETQGF